MAAESCWLDMGYPETKLREPGSVPVRLERSTEEEEGRGRVRERGSIRGERVIKGEE